MFGPWINNEWQKLRVSLGVGPDEGPKLDMSLFGLFFPVFFVLTLYYACAPVPRRYREPTHELIFYILLAIFCLIFQGEYRPSLRQFGLGVSFLRSLRVWLWCLCAVGIAVAEIVVIFVVLVLLGPADSGGAGTQPGNVLAPSWFDVVSGGLIAPPLEEISFRGFLYLVMRQNWGSRRAALLSAALFAGFHSLASFPLHFTSSLLYIFINNRAKSLIPSTVAHVFYNATLLLLTIVAAKFVGQG